MDAKQQLAAYLDFLAALESAFDAPTREKILVSLNDALTQIANTPGQPSAEHVNPFSPIGNFLNAPQMQFVCTSFKKLLNTLSQPDTRTTSRTSRTRRHHASRRSSARSSS